MNLVDALRVIEQWLAVHAPVTYETLQPGLTATEIERLSDRLGLEVLPELATLLSWHDGARRTDAAFQIWTDFQLSSSQEMYESWALNNLVARRNQSTQWNAHWIPIATDVGGNYLVIDHTKQPTRSSVFRVDMVDGKDNRFAWRQLTDLVDQVRNALTMGAALNLDPRTNSGRDGVPEIEDAL